MDNKIIEYNLTGKIPIMADVPCGDCHLCCKGDLIFLHPECGDHITDYDYMPAPAPFKDRYVLRHKENGDCIYLDSSGCSIHGKTPIICREFDCRGFVKSLGYTRSRKFMKKGLLSNGVYNQGRKLLRLKK